MVKGIENHSGISSW